MDPVRGLHSIATLRRDHNPATEALLLCLAPTHPSLLLRPRMATIPRLHTALTESVCLGLARPSSLRDPLPQAAWQGPRCFLPFADWSPAPSSWAEAPLTHRFLLL
jgi:hypothetical protein